MKPKYISVSEIEKRTDSIKFFEGCVQIIYDFIDITDIAKFKEILLDIIQNNINNYFITHNKNEIIGYVPHSSDNLNSNECIITEYEYVAITISISSAPIKNISIFFEFIDKDIPNEKYAGYVQKIYDIVFLLSKYFKLQVNEYSDNIELLSA